MPGEKNSSQDSTVHTVRSVILTAAGVTIVAILVFRGIIGSDKVLFTTDGNIGQLAQTARSLPGAFLSNWVETPLLGMGSGALALNGTFLLLSVLPARIFVNSVYPVCLGLASLFLIAFLRERRIGWLPSCAGALAAFWLGTNLTLTYAGHFAKYGTLVFAAMALWCIEKASRRSSPGWSVLAGGALGAMLLEQQDLALFFGLFLGAYAVYAILRENRQWSVLLSKLVVMATLVLLIAGPTALGTYRRNVTGVANVGAEEAPRLKWEFCTQWSIPPWETVDLVAPGFIGWRSGDPEGPYWGGTGRSAGWEQTKKGFRNFRLEGIYVGAIPVVLALYAVFVVVAARRRTGSRPGDVVFWSCAAIVALMLSYGKHFPLYRLFYQLPIVSSIRNPNKFVQIFQVALGIVAAYGCHFALSLRREELDERHWKRARVFLFVVAVSGFVLLCMGAIAAGSRSGLEQKFVAAAWGGMAAVMAGNVVRSLIHAGIAVLICTGCLAVCIAGIGQRKGTKIGVGLALIAAITIDLLMLSQHYIKPVPTKSLVGANNVVEFLQQNVGQQRVLMLSQRSFYNNWLTYLFPYHDVTFFNVTQMPRMPDDYKAFLGMQGENPLRLWQLSSVGYVMAPAQILGGLLRDPVVRDQFEPVLGFRVSAFGDDVLFSLEQDLRKAQHVVLKYKSGLPRHSFVGSWEVVPDDRAVSRLASPQFDPTRMALVSPDTADALSSGRPGGDGGRVEVISSGIGKARLRTFSKAEGILLVTQKYSADWQATVDGRPVDVLRCNYLCLGVPVQPGEHTVSLTYAPKSRIWIQGIGIFLCLCAAAYMGVRWLFSEKGSCHVEDR